jgi:hypothetical protein
MRTIAILLASAACAVAQQLPTLGDPGISYMPSIESFAIVVGTWNKPAVAIRVNGEVIYGEGVTLDEASKQFWEALGKQMSQACPVVK